MFEGDILALELRSDRISNLVYACEISVSLTVCNKFNL